MRKQSLNEVIARLDIEIASAEATLNTFRLTRETLLALSEETTTSAADPAPLFTVERIAAKTPPTKTKTRHKDKVYTSPSLRSQVTKFFEDVSDPVGIREIRASVDLGGRTRNSLDAVMWEMNRLGMVTRVGPGQYKPGNVKIEEKPDEQAA